MRRGHQLWSTDMWNLFAGSWRRSDVVICDLILPSATAERDGALQVRAASHCLFDEGGVLTALLHWFTPVTLRGYECGHFPRAFLMGAMGQGSWVSAATPCIRCHLFSRELTLVVNNYLDKPPATKHCTPLYNPQPSFTLMHALLVL